MGRSPVKRLAGALWQWSATHRLFWPVLTLALLLLVSYLWVARQSRSK